MFPNSHQNYLPRDILFEKNLKISFSQNGEDGYITSYFWNDILSKKKGYYLDIGCFHEAVFSNTKLLSLVGWEGIAVDANPDFRNDWLQARPNDLFLNRCICKPGEETSEKEFYLFMNRQNSTADKERAKSLIEMGCELKDKIVVKATTLFQLAKEVSKYYPNGLDFLSIDLEYLDYLDDIPAVLELLKPQLVCLEIVEVDTNLSNLMSSREIEILAKANYKPLYLTGDNILASHDGQHLVRY